MAFKSEAQRKKLQQMVKDGKFSKEKYAEWETNTGSKPLPDRTTMKEIPAIPSGPKVKVRRAIKVPRY
jgi:hypothetical protein